MTTYTLNFSLTTDINRCNHITQICSQTTYTAKQYTQMADYILLASNKNHPDLPFIYPEEFSNPKRIHKEESLDELLEENDDELPSILEHTIKPIEPSIYKKEIRKIDHSNSIVAALPTMSQLWNIIDNIKLSLQPLDKNSRKYYNLHKLLIQLQQQQYSILECCLPLKPIIYSVSSYKQEMYNWENGILLQNGTKAYLDLTNAEHMSEFLLMLPALLEYCTEKPYSTLYELVHDTLSALHAAPLTNIQRTILSLHYAGKGNSEITAYINQKYSKKYSQSYISTILHKQIPSKIIPEYTEIYFSKLYANYKPMWRTCLSCHQTKLLTPHNFLRKSNKPGGFSMRCKECDHAHAEELAAKRSQRVKSEQNDN